MAKNQNTFAKRQREAEKKRKANAKRAKRQLRKSAADHGGVANGDDGSAADRFGPSD